MRKWNFCAGPAVLPEDVLKEVKSEFLEFNNSGTSIMEMSHRSEIYTSVAIEAKKDLIEILNTYGDAPVTLSASITTLPELGVTLVSDGADGNR